MHGTDAEFVKDDLRAMLSAFQAALALAQRLPSMQALVLIDLSALSSCRRDKTLLCSFAAGMLTDANMNQEHSTSPRHLQDTYLAYRIHLALLVMAYATEDSSAFVMMVTDECTHTVSDSPDGLAVFIFVKGAKLGPSNRPLLEVFFCCAITGNDPHVLEWVYPQIDLHAPQGPTPTGMSTLQIMLLKEVLVANTARLSPQYKQRRRREWGIEQGPFDISFLMPAGCLLIVCTLQGSQLLQSGVPEKRLAPPQGPVQGQQHSPKEPRVIVTGRQPVSWIPPNLHGIERFVAKPRF
ncbi:hypothetical protein WJX73_000252 [Symbiochloris irregularis]|uniref:Uncharacterized protein n=1 Tax=Symbiochloris irregularis TaxID=706552 RepID=A0AAW1PVP0_9CHLO